MKAAWGPGWRETAWTALDQPWDLVVIGGGITGAGIFHEAVKSGYKTVLFEAHDFVCGTSSRSSKLVHGGFRYLRNGQIKLTFQAVRERERLLKEARGLVTPLACLLANYESDSIPPWIFGSGLVLYDMLALNMGRRQYARRRRYDDFDMLGLCPGLCGDGLRGGYRFFDAQTDDARLVLRLLQEGITAGGLALNYAPVVSLLQRGACDRPPGRGSNDSANSRTSYPGSPTRETDICGVIVSDAESENDSSAGDKRQSYEVRARVVINATGAWADDIRQQVGGEARLRRLRGSHLIFPFKRLPLSRSVNVLHPQDGRPVFAFAWEGVTIVGTTDVDHRRALEIDPAIDPAEIDYLLTFINKAFPAQEICPADIQATFSGIRPVIDTGKSNPSKESREHVLWQENGLLTVAGGKLTTFRLMAHQALRAIRGRLPPVPSEDGAEEIFDSVSDQLLQIPSLTPTQRLRLLGRYGQAAPLLVEATRARKQENISGNPGSSEFTTIAESVVSWAELRWAARSEGALHLDDILLRRTRLGLLVTGGGLEQLEQIRRIVQPEMGWDNLTWERELKGYVDLLQSSYQVKIQLEEAL